MFAATVVCGLKACWCTYRCEWVHECFCS